MRLTRLLGQPRDVVRGEAIARQIEAGSTLVNDAVSNFAAQEVPFGGIKGSGVGYRHSVQGIRKYTQPHTLVIARLALKRDLHLLPYSGRRSRMLERVLTLMYRRRRRK
jgi:hypothetical protein